MATPSPLYFAMQPLQQCIFDKDDGTALAAGVVSYFSDPAFSVPKDIYEQSNAPDGTYIYTNIGSVVTLSSIGSFVDDNGQNFIPFAFPWANDTPSPDTSNPGAFQPYYITVYSAGGILQFTVTGWPANSFSEGGTSSSNISSQNILTNPQFSEVLFQPAPDSSTISVTGTETIAIAPAWDLITSGTGNVILTQEALIQTTPSDAPYSLDIDLDSGVSAVLRQRIQMSPRLLASGNLAAYFEAASTAVSHPAVNLVLSYTPSGGTQATDLIDATTSTDGSYTAFTGVVSLSGVVNPNSPLTGYVDITLTIPTGVEIAVTSFQILGVDTTTEVPNFEQQSVPLQQSQLFWYWQPALNYKPIPSYLVGWDFPLNPAQPRGQTITPIATGANGSAYFWDQTIVFQTVNNAISVARNSGNNGFQCTGTLASSFAIIQYLPANIARQILSQRNAVQLKGAVGTGSLNGTVSLYWTVDGSLPDIKSPTFDSLVTAITAGVPTTGNGTWNLVERGGLLANAPFTLSTTSTAYSFSGFDATATAAATTATFFAIVICFDTLTLANTMTLEYCSLVGGDIATRPAPQTQQEVIANCSYYFQSAFPPNVAPQTAIGSSYALGVETATVGANAAALWVTFREKMRVAPGIGLYNPINANNEIHNISPAADWSLSTTSLVTEDGFMAIGTPPGGSTIGTPLAVNWIANAQLGAI